ncbi:CBL-interacting serine/threonine-protein kinase 3 [Dendrobium catenatum]|uniref:non-specific serine/threonine protein kinase n=1 Tax=Dendrobium catenatum TaxID=906689 RepID=A0A2I0WB23_9ASPA|nr:CBL-interacting serine/threonine-protein kinase 3 [Dendrobium catenatum]
MQSLRKPLSEHSGTDLYVNIYFLSIVGHGGMGKITLLQHVYEGETTEEFDHKMSMKDARRTFDGMPDRSLDSTHLMINGYERDDGLLHTTCGTPNYVAPEVLNNRGYDGDSTDLLSCGVILFVLLAGYLPFDNDNIMNLYKKIGTGDFTFPSRLSYGYKPPIFDEKYETNLDDIDVAFNDSHVSHVVIKEEQPAALNAFELIASSKGLNLKNLFDIEQDKTKWENVLASLSSVLASLSSGSLGSKILITTRMDSAAEFYVLEILVQFNDFKVDPPHVDWGKPHHVVILKPAIKIFDPGGSQSPFGRHAST